MPGFLYFLPNERGPISPSLLNAYGLGHILDTGDKLHPQQVIRGPGNTPGLIIGNMSHGGLTVGDVKWSDSLESRPFPKSHAEKQALCCWKSGALPKPEDLARRTQLTGEALTLADGQSWLIPHARRWENGVCTVALPRVLDVDDETGEYVYGAVRPEYQQIWEHANRYWNLFVEASLKAAPGEGVSFTVTDPVDLIVAAIAANYRVSARELGILAAVDDQMLNMVASVLIDLTGADQLEKKTESDIGSG